MNDTLDQFRSLVEIVKRLRSPDGCPWDLEQTQKSLTQYAIEEAFELVEAIESGNPNEIKDELGDFLFQVVLQSQVAADENQFSLRDVLANLNQKLLERHPHVFGDVKVAGAKDVWKNWHKMKTAESQNKNRPVFSYPKNLPSLQASHKIGRKTEGLGFDWGSPKEVFAKVTEELNEVSEVLEENNQEKLQHEIGDLLFSTAQLARHCGLEPEACLREANRRFEKRFLKVLELSKVPTDQFKSLPDSTKESLWEQAKKLTL